MKPNTAQFEALPSNLPPSAYVDFLLFLSGVKPALRIFLNDSHQIEQILAWCNLTKHACIAQSDGYTYISCSEKATQHLQKIDNSLSPHEYALGIALGYPKCCCEAISLIGEEDIDKWENLFLQNSHFSGRFKLLDTSEYSSGCALISHIPCSDKCEKSYNIAKQALTIIKPSISKPHFHRWAKWLHK